MREMILLTGKPWWTFARISVNRVLTRATVFARLRCTIVNIDLATITGKSFGAMAFKTIFHVFANTSVQAWITLAFVDVIFTLGASKT